jgi:hypothetical protein
MGEAIRGTSRRSLLGRGLVVAAGALGLGAAARAERSGGVVAPSLGTKDAEQLRLYGRNFHLQAPTRRAGEVPLNGERHSAYGELLDRPNGKVVGNFTAAHLTHESPFAAAVSSLEIHTFALADGTIHGLGTAARGSDGHFVILGGTGRYSGVQGSYRASQGARELGGDGSADFHFTLAG